MADQPVSHDFLYVHTEIPAGMTIREWRAQRAASRAAATRRSRLAATGVGGSVVRLWRTVARALARPRIARVRAAGGRHRPPRAAAPPNPGARA
jgi:hypothetical protein